VIDVLPQIGLVVVLIALNAVFAGTELALVSLSEGQLQRLEARSATGAQLARLAREPNRFLATIQIGITLAGFLASAAAAVSLAEPLQGPLGFLGDAARPVSIICVTLILTYLTLVFGELAPKRIAMQRAEKWAMAAARPLAMLTTITRPAVWLLSRSTDIAVRLLGADPSHQRSDVTDEELRDMVAAHETLTPEQRRIMDGAFHVAQRTLTKVLVPRTDVYIIDADSTCRHAATSLAKIGHTRAPVAPNGSLDEALGIVHLSWLLAADPHQPARTVAVPAPVFPGAARVITTMRDLQAQRAQMAFVVNEYGRIDGIITMEDLVEELVGEIYDETDPDRATIEYEPDGTIVLPGRYPIHDLPELGIDLPTGSYATIAGFVLRELHHIPKVGTTIAVDDWTLEVRAVQDHAVTQVALRPNQSARIRTLALEAASSPTGTEQLQRRVGEP
jgi:putative hemolysin